jgi:hypothetical protein
MKPSELADFIIKIHEDLKTMDEDLKQLTIEGGIHRLMLERIDDWEMYKIYCTWARKALEDQEATKQYIRITDIIQEGIDESKRNARHGNRSDGSTNIHHGFTS